jgi:hypothetical protein
MNWASDTTPDNLLMRLLQRPQCGYNRSRWAVTREKRLNSQAATRLKCHRDKKPEWRNWQTRQLEGLESQSPRSLRALELTVISSYAC